MKNSTENKKLSDYAIRKFTSELSLRQFLNVALKNVQFESFENILLNLFKFEIKILIIAFNVIFKRKKEKKNNF